MRRTVHLLSLGCPKNRVDSEVMLGELVAEGYTVVERPDAADVIVVNTCAFIDAAKEESIGAILDLAEYKKNGSAKKLVVAGCLSQRYAPELAESMPEVDHFIGTGNIEALPAVLAGRPPPSRLPIVGQTQRTPKQVPFSHHVTRGSGDTIAIPDPDFTLTADSPRVATLPRYTRYLKVSEGCSNTCAFCIIPKLRGPQRSRSIADVVREAERLVADGTVELNLIAQDLCAYGRDLEPNQTLAQLLRALDQMAEGAGHPVWIRCLYAYPKGLTSDVIRALAAARHVVPYLDMPLQHIADGILRRMRRGKGGESTKALLRRLRAEVPGLTLRTTFITGLPGENEADFAELLEFVNEIRFEHLGAFTYSPEEDTPAATMDGQVDPVVAAARRDKLMTMQRRISREAQERLVGKTLDVLVEGVSTETELLLQGRHCGQAPDIDGVTYITDGTASPGDVVQVRIEQSAAYDLAGPMI